MYWQKLKAQVLLLEHRKKQCSQISWAVLLGLKPSCHVIGLKTPVSVWNELSCVCLLIATFEIANKKATKAQYTSDLATTDAPTDAMSDVELDPEKRRSKRRVIYSPDSSPRKCAKLCVRPPNVLEVRERARGPLSPCQVSWGSDITRRLGSQKGWVFLFVCFFVCLFVTLLNVRDCCAPDFAMKALEYRDDLDTVG